MICNECKGSGYINTGSGKAFDYHPCLKGCGQFEDEMNKHECKGCWVCKDDVPDDYDGHADKGEPINYPLKFWDGDTERGGD